LCSALQKIAAEDEVLVVMGSENVLPVLGPFIEATRQASITNLLVVALDMESQSFLGSAGIAHYRLDLPGIDPNTAKWVVARDILSVGCAVLLADPTMFFKQNVFAYLYRDSDVETMSLSSREPDGVIKGKVVGIDDAAMGWSRYAQTMSVNMASSSLVFLQPTVEAINLGATLAELKDPHLIEETFNEHLFLPASDQRSRPGVSTRVMMVQCFCYSAFSQTQLTQGSVAINMASEEDPLAAMSAKLSGGVGTKIKGRLGRLRNKFALPSYGQQSPHTTSMNEIIASKDMAVGKALVMQHGCDVQPRQGPPPRAMNWQIPISEEFPPRLVCQSAGLKGLCEVLAKVHIDREVLVAVSNKNIFHMLNLYFEGVRMANVSNVLMWLWMRRRGLSAARTTSRTGCARSPPGPGPPTTTPPRG